MIHYLAEQIKQAEQKSAKNRPAILEKCFETILTLWQHKHELPNGTRPFEGMEPVLRALQSLDPTNRHYRYFPPAPPYGDDSHESKETRQWLQLAEGIDYSARILIWNCIGNAAASSTDKTKEWVALAEQAQIEDVDLPILKIILEESDLNETSSPDDEQQKQLQDRAGRLRALLKLAAALLEDYEGKLKGGKPEAKTTRARKSRVPVFEPRLAKPTQFIIEDRTASAKKRVTKTPRRKSARPRRPAQKR
jgi:hypothetical protein